MEGITVAAIGRLGLHSAAPDGVKPKASAQDAFEGGRDAPSALSVKRDSPICPYRACRRYQRAYGRLAASVAVG